MSISTVDFERNNYLPIYVLFILQPYLGGYIDAFVAKLNATGSALVYSTYLGGSGNDLPYSIAVDPASNAYVTGRTESADFPTQNPLQRFKGVADAFVTKIRTLSLPEFFDDFHYTSVEDARLRSHGWRVVNWPDGPPDGAIYSKENIEFQDDPFLGQRVLVLKADRPTAGEGIDALPAMSRLETPPYFREGTFAALVRFDDAPIEFRDTSIQTFYLIIYPFKSYCGKEQYSEVDFEYLPYNTWWAHAWWRTPFNFYRTLQLASFKTADCAHQNLVYRCDQIPLPGEPQTRWTQILVQPAGGQVRFFLDGALQSFTAAPPYYPESDMQICLANWIENLKSRLRWQYMEREYLFQVDWIYFSQNPNLSWDKVQSRVNYLRSKGIARLPKNGLPKYAW
jgi:hypothetical protein